MDARVKTLADKAMLAKLTRRKMSTKRRDIELEQTVRKQVADDGITINKQLFQDKAHPVRQLLGLIDEVYTEHTRRTAPWVDRGPRILPSDHYFDYCSAMRDRIDAIDRRLPGILNNWGKHVMDDLAARGSRGKLEDYPEETLVAAMFHVDFVIYPLPDVRDFRVQVDPDMAAKLQEAVTEAEAAVRHEVLERMLKPLRAAAEKLMVPIGEKGAIFRDSLVDNLIEGLEQARLLNIGDADLTQIIEQTESMIKSGVSLDPEQLRGSQPVREATAKQLNAILSNLGGITL